MAKKGLGKGLEAVLGSDVSQASNEDGATLQEIALLRIRPNPKQPRTFFHPEQLNELASSIRRQGVMQPIVVRRKEDYFELVAGERRWRAAQQAGLTTIPVVIKEVSDEESLIFALVENLQREDLNPVEEARALQRLYSDFGLKQADIGDAIGKSRTAIANLIRLLNLPKPVLELLGDGFIDEGHARVLLLLEDQRKQEALANDTVRRKLTVRQLNMKVHQIIDGVEKAEPAQRDPDIVALERDLTDELGTRVQIQQRRRKTKGVLAISFANLEKLTEVIERLQRK